MADESLILTHVLMLVERQSVICTKVEIMAEDIASIKKHLDTCKQEDRLTAIESILVDMQEAESERAGARKMLASMWAVTGGAVIFGAKYLWECLCKKG